MSYTDVFESLVHTVNRYPGNVHMILLHIHTHTYSIIAKSSVDIDCELEILYSNTAYVYVYNTMISSGTRCPVWTTNPKASVLVLLTKAPRQMLT